MIVIDPGHTYALQCLDAGREESQVLRFVKRQGEKYPGNTSSYPGTTLQEVFRACIDRLKYVDNQVPDVRDKVIIQRLREAIIMLEDRAAERHGRRLGFYDVEAVETIPTDPLNGHWKFGGPIE